MSREFNFKFDELTINHQVIGKVLGYGDGPLPEPFDSYLEVALNDVRDLTDIKATYRVIDELLIDQQNSRLLASGLEFHVGKTVCKELKGSEKLAFFVCTAGKTISEKSAELLKGEDPVLGYVYDILGSSIAEAASKKMQDLIYEVIKDDGVKMTNRYSPGYCNWSVDDQHKLFSLFEEAPCGITLTPSSLMHPVKSVSGVFGIGREVKYREYPCTICWKKDCVYRIVESN
jgi:hypothetical protein